MGRINFIETKLLEGQTESLIAVQLNLSRERIRQIIKEHKLEPKVIPQGYMRVSDFVKLRGTNLYSVFRAIRLGKLAYVKRMGKYFVNEYGVITLQCSRCANPLPKSSHKYCTECAKLATMESHNRSSWRRFKSKKEVKK